MRARKMHADEVDTDSALVRRLLAAQFPTWAGLPIETVESAGTDNAIYRLGDDMVVRLPRKASAASHDEKEYQWLPSLAPQLPLAVPVPLAIGEPAEGYPYPWSVRRWLGGESAIIEPIGVEAALDLANFITALRRIDSAGGPAPGAHNFGRGAPLITRDAATRSAIEELGSSIDAGAATAAWGAALGAPAWKKAPVWIHGDLIPGNLLLERGRLCAVIDFGGLGVGDPACDLMAAWTLFSGESRSAFRAALAVDDVTWARGRGWALSWALIFVPYYRDTNPAGVVIARRTIDEVLADFADSR
jgi:aminoglycoside phosphotransferase (APT) family kinase protein